MQQNTPTINQYGDRLVVKSPGFGSDIGSQRIDDLDKKAIEYARKRAGLAGPCVALDVACGAGYLAMTLAREGSIVTATDLQGDEAKRHFLAARGVRFLLGDMRYISDVLGFVAFFDLIVCQRALHYLHYEEAKDVLYNLSLHTVKDALLCVSFSGMSSELGDNYPDKGVAITKRFARLAPERAEKHGILEPVCLYEANEAIDLVNNSGWIVEQCWLSEFGNVKIVAKSK